MPTIVTMQQDFAAPVERVFAALDDHANMDKWLGGKITLVNTVPDGGVGSVRRVSLGLKRFDEEIFEREAPTHIVYKIVRGLPPLNHHRGEIRVQALPKGGTHVQWQIELGSRVPLLASVVGLVLKIAIGSALARLNRQLAR